MPPPVEPVALRILEELKSTLEAVAAGSDYWNTFLDVRIAQGGAWVPDVFPAVLLIPLSDSNARGPQGLLYHEDLTWDLGAVAVFENPQDPPTTLLRAMHDIHKALRADPQRNGLAVNTGWLGHTPSIEVDELGTLRAWVECRFNVQYRTDNTDMTQAV